MSCGVSNSKVLEYKLIWALHKGKEGKEDNVKYNMNDKDNNADNIFSKLSGVIQFSEPRAQAEVNDGSEYNMGDKNVKDDKGDNKNFFQKYQMPYIFETTSLIRSEWWQWWWGWQEWGG